MEQFTSSEMISTVFQSAQMESFLGLRPHFTIDDIIYVEMGCQMVQFLSAVDIVAPTMFVNLTVLILNAGVRLKFSGGGGGRVGDTFKTSLPLRTTFAFTHPLFKDVFGKIP